MSAPSAKSFCVRFTATSCYKVTLTAKSSAQAVAKARRLWNAKGEEPFTCFEGDTDGWEAWPD
jgi:hypothetical protein